MTIQERPDLDRLRRGVLSAQESERAASYIDELEDDLADALQPRGYVSLLRQAADLRQRVAMLEGLLVKLDCHQMIDWTGAFPELCDQTSEVLENIYRRAALNPETR